MDNPMTLEAVKEYYGRVLSGSKDLQTTACCTSEAMPRHLSPLLKDIHDEIKDRFYGCGSPIPSELSGRTVLDLGCGTGRDCYLLSRLVGPTGRVIGLDMTDEQLNLARKHLPYQTEKYGYSKPNVEFKKGFIEDLESAGVPSNSIDVVISNCVLNLSPDKKRVFKEIARVLKVGGELYFSDVFSSRRVPKELKNDKVLLGECLAGALYIEDFRRLLFGVGIPDYRIVTQSPIAMTNPEIERKIGMIDFSSVTIRAFKLEDLEDRCEDFGQVAYYLGTIPEHPHGFLLDNHHLFKKGMPVPVCSNTASMIQNTRYSKHFKVTGDTTTHYGLFDCGPTSSLVGPSATGTGACC